MKKSNENKIDIKTLRLCVPSSTIDIVHNGFGRLSDIFGTIVFDHLEICAISKYNSFVQNGGH